MSVYQRWSAKLAGRRALLATAEKRAAYWRKAKAKARKGTERYSLAGKNLADREHWVRVRRHQVAEAERVVARHKPVSIRERAYRAAASQVGVMETGGNNSGVPLTRYIRSNGGGGPEAWCGDFQAWAYRQAGSKAVTRLWASVFYLGRIAGLHRTSQPERGDLVRFTFDHVGMFVKDNGDGTITTIEGNTGASGAVSDSRTGGDGVYLKVRAKGLVQDYLRVER